MHSKNKKAQTALEKQYVAIVASLPCSVCDKPGPSQVHEPRQGQWFGSAALCEECHTGKNGIHGDKAMWRIMKMDEQDAVVVTVRRVFENVFRWGC